MILLASITDRLVEVATNVVGDLGLAGVFVLMLLESACIPIPSEVTMVYAGYLVSQGDLVFWQAVLVGAFANLVPLPDGVKSGPGFTIGQVASSALVSPSLAANGATQSFRHISACASVPEKRWSRSGYPLLVRR